MIMPPPEALPGPPPGGGPPAVVPPGPPPGPPQGPPPPAAAVVPDLPDAVRLATIVDHIGNKARWPMHNGRTSGPVPSPAVIADVKTRAEVIRAAGAGAQIAQAGRYANIQDYMAVLIIYRAAIDARANTRTMPYSRYLRRARFYVDRIEANNGIPLAERLPTHKRAYHGVIGRGEKYTGGNDYTGKGTTITLGLILYTAGEYFLYMLIIMMLMYLCFAVFIHNKPCVHKIPADTTDVFIKPKTEGYADMEGGREINVI